MVSPTAFENGNIICFSAPGFEVDAALETILLKGLHDHAFCVDLCREDKRTINFSSLCGSWTAFLVAHQWS